MIRTVIALACCTISMYGCNSPSVYEEFKDIPNQTWYTDSALVFSFPMSDTVAMYRVSYEVRNHEDYPNANLYVKYELFAPSGEVLRNGMHESILMDLKTGKPLGVSSIGSIYTHVVELFPSQKFLKPGTYTLSFRQYLRPDELIGIQSFGVRIEKINQVPN